MDAEPVLDAGRLAVAGAVSFFDEFSDLSECIESAGGDPVAERQCQTDFEDGVITG